MKSSAWFGHSASRGMTLVEVVVGIALLAMLLVLILSSFRVHASQIRSAKQRMEAIRRADSLLTVWSASGGIPPVGEQEPIPERPGWSWRIVRGTGSDELYQIGASAIRLEIVDSQDQQEKLPLASVELLVPAEGMMTP